MLNKRTPTPVEISAAKVSGWTVRDLNDNTAGLRVRGPNWILMNPIGETMQYGWTEEDAWKGILRTEAPEHNMAIALIQSERWGQDKKWGEQNHEAGKWSLILTEELGEVAKSQLEGDRVNYLTELVQAAAVLVAWLECELRKEQ